MEKICIVLMAVFSVMFFSSSVSVAKTELPSLPVKQTIFMDSDADFSELAPSELYTLINANLSSYPSYVVLNLSTGVTCYMFDSFSVVGVRGNKEDSFDFWVNFGCNCIQFYWNGNSWVAGSSRSFVCSSGKDYLTYVDSSTKVLFNSSDILEYESGACLFTAYSLEHYWKYGYERGDVGEEKPPEEETSILDWLINLPSLIWDFFKSSFNLMIDTLKNIDSFLNDLSDSFIDMLSYLFVPEENPFSSLQDEFNKKFPIIGQLTNCVKILFTADSYYNVYGSSQTADELNNGYDTGLNLSFTYKGKLYRLNGFEWLNTYGVLKRVRTVIMAFLWSMFAVRMYRKLPSIISGLHG